MRVWHGIWLIISTQLNVIFPSFHSLPSVSPVFSFSPFVLSSESSVLRCPSDVEAEKKLIVSVRAGGGGWGGKKKKILQLAQVNTMIR